MTSQTLHYFIKIILLLWLMSVLPISEAATASATISARIIQPAPLVGGLTLSAMMVDLSGRKSGELIIYNQSGMRREVGMELMAASAGGEPCAIRFSPVASSIPPDGYQVVRILMRSPCKEAHRMVINDRQIPGAPVFNVPVHTVPN